MTFVAGFGLFAAGAATFASLTGIVIKIIEFKERKQPSKHDVRNVEEHI